MWFFPVLAGLFLLAANSPPTTKAFNVETKHYTSYQYDRGSMFGFAVLEYIDINHRGMVVVGAPKAQTAQRGVTRGGAVYRCDISTDNSCRPIEFDRTGNNVNGKGEPKQIDEKSNQWFGATLSTSGTVGGKILACAPRYIWFTTKQDKQEPVGTCWVTNFTNIDEYAPCRTRMYGYHQQGWCQAGFGAAVSKDDDRLFIGAPGSWYWQGQMYSIDSSGVFPYVPPRWATYGFIEGDVYVEPGRRGDSRVLRTQAGSATEDDSYMGYTVVSGDFVGSGQSGAAVGMPRADDLYGKVLLFTWDMSNYHNISGEQMGAYFGYSIAAGDIDGDGLDDLIVGAPMYTISGNPEMTYETGRVYAIYQGRGNEKFHRMDNRDGKSNRGRFGTSIAFLGDIDKDGYGDIAVGAPYAGPEGRGAVYLYRGTREGLMEEHSQVIHSEDLQFPVQTFGFSLAGGTDLDGNNYPDIVIGAYESDAAMFFRSRPVIKMDSFVKFNSESNLISLDNRNCTLSDRTKVTCMLLEACFLYTGEGIDPSHEFNVQYVLDVKKDKNPRMFFLEYEDANTRNFTVTVHQNTQFCRTVSVYVTPNIRDKLTSLDAEMRMSLSENNVRDDYPRNPRSPLRPILGMTTSRKDALSIRKNCGSDNVCIPDLQMTVKPNVERYLLGSSKRLEIEVTVNNADEDAFEATFRLALPPGIDYIKIERAENIEIPVQCSAPTPANNNTLICDIGNPLPQNKLVQFIVMLQPVTSDGMKASYEFDMEVDTANPERNATIDDNRLHLSLPIWIKSELLIEGESKPKDLYYNVDNYTAINITTDSEFGPAIIHNYTIRNQGPSDILEAEAYLVWPARTLENEDLLYLIEQPETSGVIACETANANYLSLKINRRRKPDYFSERPGLILEESDSGKNINVQRPKVYTEEERKRIEAEGNAHIGDSSGIQHSRHGSGETSSNTRRVQITTADGKPALISTTYTESLPEGGGSSGHRGGTAIYGSTSGSGDATFVRAGDSSSTFASRGTLQGGGSNWQTQGQNKTAHFHHQWNGESAGGSGVDETVYGSRNSNLNSGINDNDRRYHELRKQQELQRLREEERIRQHQARVNADYGGQTHRSNEEVYGTTRHFSTDSERNGSRYSGGTTGILRTHVIDGDREDVVGNGDFSLRGGNVATSQDLEKFFSSLTKDASAYNVYSKQGRQFATFDGRFRNAANGKEYIEFRDGTVFALQDRYGRDSLSSGDNAAQQTSFTRLEGQLVTGNDGKAFIELRDGRRFPLHGSYSYTEERTYTLGGGGREGGARHYTAGTVDPEEDDRSYGRVYHEEHANQGRNQDGDFESYSSRSHEEKHNTERKFNTRLYGGDDEDDVPIGDNVPTSRPDLRNYRYRRESDVVTVEDFKKFERRHRPKRELIGDDGVAFFRVHRNRRADDDDEEEEVNVEGDLDPARMLAPCPAVNCVTLRCTMGPLQRDQEVSIAVRYRVNVRTLKKVAYNEQVKVSTQLIAQVMKQPFIGKPMDAIVQSHEVYTNIQPTAAPSAPDVVPLWVVVLSACAGTIILLLLIYLLYKCGFFKRNRPTDSAEREPLNRNGY